MSLTVLITGTGSGFGRGTALGPARLGHHVVSGAQTRPHDLLSELDGTHALTHDPDAGLR